MVDIVCEPMEGGIARVIVSGAADRAAAPALRRAMMEVLDEPDARLIVDLTKTSFLDSATLGTLAASYERNRLDDGIPPRMAIVCPEGDVRTMFAITALDSLLPIAGTIDDARAVVGSG